MRSEILETKQMQMQYLQHWYLNTSFRSTDNDSISVSQLNALYLLTANLFMSAPPATAKPKSKASVLIVKLFWLAC